MHDDPLRALRRLPQWHANHCRDSVFFWTVALTEGCSPATCHAQNLAAAMPQEAGAEVDAEEENWDTNRPADVYLPSPDRVDKVSRQWSIPADAWQGSVEKARKGSRLAVASLADVTKKGLSSLGLADAPSVAAEGRSRPGRKRKGAM